MGQTAFEMQVETCMNYLSFPQGIRCFCMPYCIVFLGVIEKSCQKLVLRVSSGGYKHLETIKARGRRPSAFISFSVFGTPDETLALVFDILRQFQFGVLGFFGCSGVLECSSVLGCSGVPGFSTCRQKQMA